VESDPVDIARLAAWMDEQGLEQGPIQDLTPLIGGSQNIIVSFRRGDRPFVLRRPPRHPRMDGNETMRREARVLGALAQTSVPHPRLIAACPESGVLGAAFYLMEQIAGFNAANGLPVLHAESATIRRDMGLAMADALVTLGQVDYRAVGLADFGRIEGFLDRQVARWRSQLDSYADYAGWPGPGDIPGIDRVAAWLDTNRPRSFKPGIMHGDYHLKNVLFRYDGPQIAAIVDWELATIGDPLIDLGWLIALWHGPAGELYPSSVVVEPWDGFPAPDELVSRYGEHSPRDLSAMPWYVVFACYKLGIILEGSHARACDGKAPKATGDRLHASALSLFQRALAEIARA
jgi:aminoglycoside phosphotransferase (APT) family kinase protein